MQITVSLEGDKELIAALKALPANLERKALKTAVRESAKPILKAARANAPRDTGQLRRSIKLRSWKRSRKGRVGFSVGMGSKDYVGKTFYGSFQEYGWRVGKRSTGVKFLQRKARGGKTIGEGIKQVDAVEALNRMDSRRFIEGRHFIRSAFRTHAVSTQRGMAELIRRAIDKTVADAARKTLRAKGK